MSFPDKCDEIRWLRSPWRDLSNSFECILASGSKYPSGASAYASYKNGVAFGFDKRICSVLTAYLLVALSVFYRRSVWRGMWFLWCSDYFDDWL